MGLALVCGEASKEMGIVLSIDSGNTLATSVRERDAIRHVASKHSRSSLRIAHSKVGVVKGFLGLAELCVAEALGL